MSGTDVTRVSQVRRVRRLLWSLIPSPGNVLFTLLAIGTFVWVQSAGALPLPGLTAAGTSTSTIAYQGRLTNTGGAPVNGNQVMNFRLYNVATGGSVLWEETWAGANSIAVTDGLFNTLLGSLTPIPQATLTTNSTLWLGISVGTDGEMTPRVQVGSVPYAMQAQTVPDGSISAAKLADGAVTPAKLSTLVATLNDAQTLTNKTLLAPLFQGNVDGWIMAGESWTYLSPTSFTVEGDATARFSKGTRIKLTQTSTKYFVVISSSFSTVTTVTITGGSDYSLVNAAISIPAYSYAANPQGYPTWFNYTPIWTGFSIDPTSGTAKFSVMGTSVMLVITGFSPGTSNNSVTTVSLPIAAVTSGSNTEYGYGAAFDNNTWLDKPARWELMNGATTLSVKTNPNGNGWTSSGAKLWYGTVIYQI